MMRKLSGGQQSICADGRKMTGENVSGVDILLSHWLAVLEPKGLAYKGLAANGASAAAERCSQHAALGSRHVPASPWAFCFRVCKTEMLSKVMSKLLSCSRTLWFFQCWLRASCISPSFLLS